MTAVAFARSRLDRTRTLAHFVPELAGTPGGEATIELLLSHRAGLQPHVKLFDEDAPPEGRASRFASHRDRMEALIEVAKATRDDLAGDAPHPPVYSDVGYLLVGEAMARALGFEAAGDAIRALAIQPLALRKENDEWLGTPAELDRAALEVAPTEVVPWRGGAVVGEVHDENAWVYGEKRGCGHAGVFGTVSGVLAFGRAVYDALTRREGPYADADLAWTRTPRPGGTLRAGWDGKSPEGSSAGARASDRTFGHLGFTGTSLWIDEGRGAVVSLLTNRVYPTRENTKIREWRPIVHDELFSLADAIAAKLRP